MLAPHHAREAFVREGFVTIPDPIRDGELDDARESELTCMCDDLGKCTLCIIEELREEMGV